MRTVVLVVLLGVVSGVSAVAQEANGQVAPTSGERITLFLRNVDLECGPLDNCAPDMLIFTGGPTFQLASFPGCSGGDVAIVQNAVLVDPNGVRSGRHVSVIVAAFNPWGASGPSPVAPGTRVSDFVGGTPCFSNGVDYRTYE